jgi:hypothetical protein
MSQPFPRGRGRVRDVDRQREVGHLDFTTSAGASFLELFGLPPLILVLMVFGLISSPDIDNHRPRA